MASVQTLHPVPTPKDSTNDLDTPTTPRLHQMDQSRIQHISVPIQKEEENNRTPTTASFAEANGKRSLPLSPPPPAHASIAKHVIGDAMSDDGKRPASQRSNRSADSDMHGADGSHTSPENDGSEVESGDDDTNRPAKKKKGQRFFCTEYPPCNLSFTRSEHLARHIRKHTGERPFQCHCNRRFSRLDNLRQHAQTVHVNEEIPTDSLAATGTRFQRQIRTDRVRPAGARSRASTTSSVNSHHGRGHSRNLSTSSIASTASNMSTISTISQDPRMHPHPLMMAPEQRSPANLTIDTHRASAQYNYTPTASGGPTTPTSTSYTGNPGSPYSSYSTITSPASTSRYPSYEGSRHARRLSVPNGPNPYQVPYQQTPSSPANPSFVLNSSSVASPTGSVFSTRQEISPAEAEMRRRTWHPSTYSGYNYQRPATSGLSYSQTPDAPQPAAAPQATAAASQPVTLPGFRELVTNIARPATPPNQVSGQQLRESPNRPPAIVQGSSSERNVGAPTDRPAHRSWDVSLHQNLNRLDIASGTPPREVGWGQQAMSDPNYVASTIHGQQIGHLQLPSQSHHAPPPQHAHQQPLLGPALHTVHGPTQHAIEAEPSSPNRSRRQGWQQGPLAPAPHATVTQQPGISPASSISEGVPTPNNPSFEHHPNIVHSNGYVEPARPAPQPQLQPPQHHALQQPFHHGSYPSVAPKTSEQPPLSGLDALVAVATSQSQGHGGQR